MKRIFALLVLLATFASAQTDSTDILITVREDGDTTTVGRWRAGMPVVIRDSWDGWGNRERFSDNFAIIPGSEAVLSNKFVIVRVGIAKARIDTFLAAHTDSATGLRRKYQLSRSAIQFIKNNRDQNNIVRVTPAQLRNAFKRANRLRRFGEPQRMSIIPDRLYIKWRNMLIAATPTSVTVNTDGGGDYTSLAAAEAGEQKDLVTANEQLTISCSGTTADVTAVTVDGWTTDATRDIVTQGDNNTGVWDDTKYRLIITTGSVVSVGVDAEFVNLQTYKNVDLANAHSYTTLAAINLTIKNCIVRGFGSIAGSGTQRGVSIENASNVKIVNTVFYDHTSTSLGSVIRNNGGTVYCYNVTIDEGQYCYLNISGSFTVINCIAQANNNAFTGTFTAGSDYNISNLAGAAPGANSLNNTTVNFADASAGDFRLLAGSPGIDAGTPDTTGLGLPTTDIAGNSRISNDRIDVGAFEYQVSTPSENTDKKSRYKGFGTGSKGGWKK